MDVSKRIKESLRISLYSQNPPQITYLHENENICENRLMLYKIIQETSHKFQLFKKDWVEGILNGIVQKNLRDFLGLFDETKLELIGLDLEKLTDFSGLIDFNNCFRKDEIGHFFMALVCSKDEQLQDLFLSLEVYWFQIKFHLNVSEDETVQFLIQNGITIPTATFHEISLIKREVSNFYHLDPLDTTSQIFKISFVDSPSLLENREVLIKNGYFYFPTKKQIVCEYVKDKIRMNWKVKLKNLSKYWLSPNKDDRIVDLVDYIMPYMRKLLYDGEIEHGTLTLNTIDSHSKTIFPLCMSQLHEILRHEHHLKHDARIQYAIFLKNAGMPYEDAIEYFRTEMTKKMTEEDFVKQKYFYYFSHSYGKVGGKIDYAPQSCDDIFNNTPHVNQKHGCPFAHYSSESLSELLRNRGIEHETISAILEEKEKNQFKRACGIYFTCKVGSVMDFITSPNGYYCCALQNSDIEDIFGQ